MRFMSGTMFLNLLFRPLGVMILAFITLGFIPNVNTIKKYTFLAEIHSVKIFYPSMRGAP